MDVALCVMATSRHLAGVDLAADVGVAVMVGLALAYLQREGGVRDAILQTYEGVDPLKWIGAVTL